MVSKTTIAQYDRAPGYDGVFFTRLLVIGVGEKDERRRLFEDVFCRVLSGDGVYLLPSWKGFPQSQLITETELEAAIGTKEFDGVLITRLVRVDETTSRFETNLYATSDSGLVWSARSTPVDPGSAEESIESMARAVAAQLREEGLIRWALFVLSRELRPYPG